MSSGFGPAAPIFRVASVRASLDYYVAALGFAIDWDEGGIVSVSRDRCTIFLCEWAQGERGSWTWLGVHDVEAVHEELRGRGARIRQEPTNFPWALEMQVEDLDRNVLRLGSDPKRGVPYGEFLDANGTRWNQAESAG